MQGGWYLRRGGSHCGVIVGYGMYGVYLNLSPKNQVFFLLIVVVRSYTESSTPSGGLSRDIILQTSPEYKFRFNFRELQPPD